MEVTGKYEEKMKKLYYIHDPMCSWCWAFRKTWLEVKERLSQEQVLIQYVVGGLAPDSNAPMPAEMQSKLENTWRTIQQRVPGTEFNFDFWRSCKPRRSTYPACRAALIARQHGQEQAMIFAIQQAYYLGARNPSDLEVLADLAEAIGLARDPFVQAMQSEKTDAELSQQISLGQSLGAQGFPSLVLEAGHERRLLELDYNSAEKIVRQII